MQYKFQSNRVLDSVKISKDYFRSPLDIPLFLVGNFGEIRNNHFHSGIDIKTEGREGLPVFAPADGYICRIKIQGAGYGNALYIKHPNGFVTVYGHLSAYNSPIAEYVKSQQYKAESFEIDIDLNPDILPVKKSDIVAFTGNTGGSRGPHLHFEIRDDKAEIVYNPLLFGFDIKDSVKPTISKIALYPMNEISFINNINEPQFYSVQHEKLNNLTLKVSDTVMVHGFIGFGLTTYDTENNRSNVNGTYMVELKVDEQPIYRHRIDHFSFDQWRYVNAHIDYPLKQKNGSIIQRCHLLPNNKLPIYELKKNRGYFLFTDDAVHKIELIAADIYGNHNNVNFWVKSSKISKEHSDQKKPRNFVKKFFYNQPNSYTSQNFELSMDKDVIYDDIDFTFSSSDSSNSFAPVYHVHSKNIPVQSPYEIKIKPRELSTKLRNKAVIVSLNTGSKISEGGEWDSIFGGLKTTTKIFGDFTIAVDTVPPVLSPLNKIQNQNLRSTKSIRFKMYDGLSGVKTFRGTIDGQWILMQLDSKNNLLYHVFDKSFASGKHDLIILLEDKKGNSKKYQYSFSN